jgi:hypothetical protein
MSARYHTFSSRIRRFLRPGRAANGVKFSLTLDQGLRLLRIGGRRTLCTVESIHHWRGHMTNEILVIRVAQALLAVAGTTASVLILQYAMLAG